MVNLVANTAGERKGAWATVPHGNLEMNVNDAEPHYVGIRPGVDSMVANRNLPYAISISKDDGELTLQIPDKSVPGGVITTPMSKVHALIKAAMLCLLILCFTAPVSAGQRRDDRRAKRAERRQQKQVVSAAACKCGCNRVGCTCGK